MGQEISEAHFRKQDFTAFEQRLREETRLLGEALRSGTFADAEGELIGGFEVEAWLVDGDCHPAPINQRYLELLNDPLVVPELAMFNVELNSSPQPLQGNALKRMEVELQQTWHRCREAAHTLDAELLMIGILPTVRQEDLTLANMSRMTRYRALNEQVLRLRQGRPLRLDIHGHEHLCTEHHDVMLESAATSFQVHLQVPQSQAARYYNVALVLSAPMVAASANSPYLFGKDLWDETRIPLFEQAVQVGGFAGAAFGPVRRVTFGTGYVRDSLVECFQENLEHYPVLLPIHLDEAPERFAHLRLHNGTIWRWNRPLVGFDEQGVPHLRVEHRVVPAGASVVDAIANAALFFGLATELVKREPALESRISFSQARDNFYAAARRGLHAQFTWLGRRVSAQTLLLEELLPAARSGLESLDLARDDIDGYLGIIEARVRGGRTGAGWQRAFVAKYGSDMRALTAAYLERQRSGAPVHEWDV